VPFSREEFSLKTNEPAVPRLALRVPEAAQALGASVPSVYAWMKAGKLGYVRLPGGSIRIPVAALEKMLEELTVASDPSAR
jgi:excisionase family DNA binding protein